VVAVESNLEQVVAISNPDMADTYVAISDLSAGSDT